MTRAASTPTAAATEKSPRFMLPSVACVCCLSPQ
jgi:hypothetical protein